MNTHVEHRILSRKPEGLLVEITAEAPKSKKVVVTEYLVASVGLQCEAYAVRKTEPGEGYATWDETKERYLVIVDPRTGSLSCDCKGCMTHHHCKHTATISLLREEAEIGPRRDQAVYSLTLLNIPLTREQLDGAAARALLTLRESLAKAGVA